MGELKALFIVGTSCKKRASGGFFSNTKLLIFGNFYFIIGKSLNSFHNKRISFTQWQIKIMQNEVEKYYNDKE